MKEMLETLHSGLDRRIMVQKIFTLDGLRSYSSLHLFGEIGSILCRFQALGLDWERALEAYPRPRKLRKSNFWN